MENKGLKSAFLILLGMTTLRDISGQLWGKAAIILRGKLQKYFISI